MTAAITDDVLIGDPVEFHFYLIHNDMPKPMLGWYEWPGAVIAALTFDPPITGCNKFNFYINPTKKRSKPLSSRSLETTPINLRNVRDELEQWKHISDDDKCAILITLGTINDINFKGISASTRDGHFRRETLKFPKAEPPDSSSWPGIVLAPAVDVLWWSNWAVRYPLARPMCPSMPDTMQVSFDFPDGTSKETTLDVKEAGRLVKSPFADWLPSFFECGFGWCPDWACVKYWVHAALYKLRLEFRDVRSGGRRLVSINGYTGIWEFGGERDLTTTIRDIYKSSINFTVKVASGPDITSNAKWFCPSADKGIADSQRRIGDLYYDSASDPEKNRIHAYVWYSLAAKGNNSLATKRLRLLENELTSHQLEEAQNLLTKWKPGKCKQEIQELMQKESEIKAGAEAAHPNK